MAEYLVIDAELTWDGTFELLYSYTTGREPHALPPGKGDDQPLMALVLDGDGKQVASALLRRFQPPEQDDLAPVWDVRGVVPLARTAARVRIVTAESEPVAEFDLGDEPELRLEVEPTKNRSGALVRVSYDPRPSGSWMAVQLLSESQGPRTLHFGSPRESIEVDLDGIWAPEVRIGVLYSTGTRGASAVSEAISIKSAEAPLVVSAPPANSVLSSWDYIDCIATLRLPVPNAEDLLSSVRWTVDGDEAGHGRLITIGPLAPGKHEITATIEGPDDVPGGSDSVVVTVRDSQTGKRSAT